MYTIRLSRAFETWPEGVRHCFPKGDYSVPSQMSELIAGRALRSGIGTAIREPEPIAEPKPTKGRSPQNKMQRAAPENKRLDS